MSFIAENTRFITQCRNFVIMKHPFQLVVSNKTGSLLFTTSQNVIQVFNTETGERLGSWIDDVDTTQSLKEKVKKEQERQIAENQTKKSNGSEEPAVKKQKKNNTEPKVPTPGPGAPKVFNYIRALDLTPNEKYLIAATDSDKAGVIFEIDTENKENILKLIKRQPFPKRPSAVTSSTDSSNLVIGDKFGDVYSVPINSEVVKEINAESEPLLGHVSMLTDLIIGSNEGKQYVLTADRDEHIRVSQYPNGFVIENFLFGHTEFVSQLVIPSFKPSYLLSGGGDSTVFLWDWTKGKLLNKFELNTVIESYISDAHLAPSKFQNESNDLREICVSKIIALDSIQSFAVLVESTNVILILRIDEQDNLILDKIIELKDKIISITASENEIIASVESEEDLLLQVIDLNTKEISPKGFTKKITQSSKVEINSKDEIFPLYTTYQLRKRGEH